MENPDRSLPDHLKPGSYREDEPSDKEPVVKPIAKRTGRPTTLDEMKKGQIVAIISVGCNWRTAAHYVQCTPQTIRNEAARDEKFCEQLHQAERSRAIMPLRQIRAAGEKSWRAAAWLLERTQGSQYLRRPEKGIPQEEVREEVERFINVVLDEVVDPEVRARITERLNEEEIDDLQSQIRKLSGSLEELE